MDRGGANPDAGNSSDEHKKKVAQAPTYPTYPKSPSPCANLEVPQPSALSNSDARTYCSPNLLPVFTPNFFLTILSEAIQLTSFPQNKKRFERPLLLSPVLPVPFRSILRRLPAPSTPTYTPQQG